MISVTNVSPAGGTPTYRVVLRDDPNQVLQSGDVPGEGGWQIEMQPDRELRIGDTGTVLVKNEDRPGMYHSIERLQGDVVSEFTSLRGRESRPFDVAPGELRIRRHAAG